MDDDNRGSHRGRAPRTVSSSALDDLSNATLRDPGNFRDLFEAAAEFGGVDNLFAELGVGGVVLLPRGFLAVAGFGDEFKGDELQAAESWPGRHGAAPFVVAADSTCIAR